MSDKVYIVAVSGVETYWIRHVCASEETAKKRFKELKISMLQEELGSIMVDIDDYNNNGCIYEDCKTEPFAINPCDEYCAVDLTDGEESKGVLFC